MIDPSAALKGIVGLEPRRRNFDLMDFVFALKSVVVGYNMERLVLKQKIVKRHIIALRKVESSSSAP